MSQACFRIRQFRAFTLTGLYSVATTASFTALLWAANARFLPEAAIGQTNQPASDRQTLPTVVPTVPVNPVVQPLPNSFPPLSNTFPATPPNARTQFDLYRLGPGDGIAVNVNRFPDLSFTANVNPEGNITAPLLGTISVRGLTLEEVQERLRVGFNRYVIDPMVVVTLGNQRPVQVTILGEVTKPGFYPVAGAQPRISNALLAAGGATNRADLREVQVRRTLIDGTVIEQRVDLFTPIANGGQLPDLRLEDGDAIVIPRLDVGEDKDYDRSLVARSTLAKQQITVRVLSYAGNGIGNINLPNGSTFLDALTAISPNLQNARLKKIALIRFDQEQGKAIAKELNGKKALMGDVSQNVPLQDNDVIIVGRNLVARITYALNTFTQPFRDVLGFLLFFSEISDSASDLFGPGSNDDDNNDDDDD
ncbi:MULTISPECIES: polysaccharide biosynthesis/export family protein [Trichocoleus]|uniref:Polysaccharide export protein n=1 Tax=Trichocoleus desertorum GB2-A4 TaxID=2933944 RepID=A0ABV0J3S2_9CYAN|nr:polysaccharide biosynthesis/export family protein [Trichocoleus sp. FACHB-46]MBD1861770.1 polysaccharide export protein [Trichocoleus sp. FACHB-46]